MLILTSKDSDNKLVHVAAAVTAKEDAESYRFLLLHSMRNPEMAAFLDSPATTFYSDGHRRSNAALEIVVPRAQHRTCVKRVINNLGQPVGSVSASQSMLFERACSCACFVCSTICFR